MKYVGSSYKTRDGALKRLAFERSVHPSELARGDVANKLVFGIEQQKDGTWRVTKDKAASQ